MSEKISTNQEIINVKLLEDNGTDIMLFYIPGEENGISVNLNETSGQKDLKNVFGRILKILNTKDVVLELNIDKLYKKGLYKEVCQEYISDLNEEIKEVREEIKNL